ncbi:MAG: hypothetical protein MUC65_00320 [Pontiellaceae bacterium]|jgi:hypothetical protein|nr:hypothetical protein [Pontiellaceae bacterium]
MSTEKRWQFVLMALICWTAAQAQTNWRITSVSTRNMDFYAISNGSGYAVAVTNNGSNVERRCYSDGHHFLSILSTGSVFALRPHPGVDLNGWGSTLYLQPFLPLPTNTVLRGSVITHCTAYSNRIETGVTGLVSRGESDQYGTWDLVLTCAYDRPNKRMTATGLYTIHLAGPLSADTGDLNLVKLASNYLDDVPLVDGTTNDTGDMAYAHVTAGTLNTNWNPVKFPGYFPSEQTTNLLVDVIGDFNCVDTLPQGHRAIQAAYKPDIKLALSARYPTPMIFGGIYDTNLSKAFNEDNIGITPLILTNSTATEFQFDVAIESTSLPGDGIGILAGLSADGTNDLSKVEVYYTDSLAQPFRRLVGELAAAGAHRYTGTVAVPFPKNPPYPAAGFFKLEILTNGN